MKVDLNSTLNCQPIRFKGDNNKNVNKELKYPAAFKSGTFENKPTMSVNEKYELAKKIIAAQNQMIEELQKQSAPNVQKSKPLNKLA